MIHNGAMIDKNLLINTYKKIRLEPIRVFLAKDLFVGNTSKYRSKYLTTLVTLGLVEQVNVVYRNRRRDNLIGYRLVSKEGKK